MVAPLGEAARHDWLRLARSDGIGPRTFIALLQRYGTAAAVIDAFPRLAAKRSGLRLAERSAIDRELARIEAAGCRLIALPEPDYPPALRSIDSAPPVIVLRGRAEVLQKPMVAIVGSRNASGAGLILTERLARGIGAAGLVVVSGLARGIDARAHLAAVPTGTVAVLAGGQDRIYPEEHTRLAAEIAESGAILSEMPMGWEPRGRDFPRRNRIVSGLSLGTVVVEAARRSGSLITARFANEQGREVFAVPGSPLDPRAEGTNDLIRQGATLCTCPEDVIDALGAMTLPARAAVEPTHVWDEIGEDDRLFPEGEGRSRSGRKPAVIADEPDERNRVMQLLGPSPVSIDDLTRVWGQGAARLRALLVDLEFDGLVLRHPGNLVSLSESDR